MRAKTFTALVREAVGVNAARRMTKFYTWSG